MFFSGFAIFPPVPATLEQVVFCPFTPSGQVLQYGQKLHDAAAHHMKLHGLLAGCGQTAQMEDVLVVAPFPRFGTR